MATTATSDPGTGKKYSILTARNADYDPEYWRILRALYEGGKALLRDEQLMNELFPKHRNEIDEVYRERKKRALYIPYCAEIIDHLIASLTGSPLVVTVDGDPKKMLPDFYRAFVDKVSPEGGQKISINELIGAQMRTALKTRHTWTLVELPSVPELPETAALADQERSGALDAYAIAIDPECVVDWEEDDAGELIWALMHFVENKRLSIDDSRSTITQRWKLYTRDGWLEFKVSHDRGSPPNPDDVIPRTAEGAHSFGRVPLRRLQLPDGLWAMNKLESLAREHFNKRSGLSWGELQALLPELYEFQQNDAGAMLGTIGEDPSRSKNQRRGQGYVQIRAEKDRAEFVGPDVAPFTEARQSLDTIRDDMHRVMHQMALSAPNSASALKRSAESKQQDTAAVDVVLGELGNIARKHVEEVLALVSIGRAEVDLVEHWKCQGMAEFDSVAVSSMIADGLSMESIKIPSTTFRKRFLMKLVRAVLGDEVPAEDIEEIGRELDKNVTDESLLPIGDPALLDARPPRTAKPAGTKPKKIAKPKPPGSPGA